MSTTCWPLDWPHCHSLRGVEGVGGSVFVQDSVNTVQLAIEGKVATLYVTIMPLPKGVNALVGRDALDQLGLVLTNQPF